MSLASQLLFLCCTIAFVLGDVEFVTKSSIGSPDDVPTSYRPRVLSIEEFISSHKLPKDIARPDDDDASEDDKRSLSKDNKAIKKVNPKFENFEKKSSYDSSEVDSEDYVDRSLSKRPARVELETFGDSGVLQEDGVRKADGQKSRFNVQRDSVLPGVYISNEYPTTMLPILTTPREARSFDFVPVNIIREDSKDSFSSFSDRHFDDLGDVSLVPAGSSSRIQVKKGPNGKDYEYEYVYYYYDEEDETKAGSSVTNTHDVPSRTTSSPRRGSASNSNRNKYSTVERSTVEPVINEVIPNRNANRGRQLAEAEDVSEERLPANTRFPPRSRSNHNTGTTEPTRARGNRPRPSLDLVDSSSFRTHQEGPEFPQSLPKGPVRFLGVTPNEDNEDKPQTRTRGRPQRVQEPAPVEEDTSEDLPVPTSRRRPVTPAQSEPAVELSRGQPARHSLSREEDDEETEETPRPSLDISKERTSAEDTGYGSHSTLAVTTDSPTTEYPSSAMDKVALDLYAFIQQGQNNLVDSTSGETTESSDGTTVSGEDTTTDADSTTELSGTAEPTEIASTTTTTTTEVPTTTTTTTEPPTTTTQLPVGRGKFRRPGVGGVVGQRNRFKSSGTSTTTESAPTETTQRNRNRFGGNSNGFKRPRPGQKQPIEEDTVQKESVGTANAEKPSLPGRGRFRGGIGARTPVSTTSAPASANGASSASTSPVPRPTFNKLNINNRRRGRPTTAAPSTVAEENPEKSESSPTAATPAPQEASPTSPKSAVRTRLPGSIGARPVIRPGARVNLRHKPGQATTTTTLPPETSAEGTVDEPAGEGTEEETHEAPAETSPPVRSTTSNPLNKLRNRNRLQVHPKTTTRSPVPVAPRRSPLLPRRKITEAPVAQTVSPSHEEESSASPSDDDVTGDPEVTEATPPETSTAASTKHEETRGLSSLLAPRRRIAPRRPGQIISRE